MVSAMPRRLGWLFGIELIVSSLELVSSVGHTVDASVPAVLGFVCDRRMACCGAHIAMARLAVKHANEREGSFVAELAHLPDNDTMPRLEMDEILYDVTHPVGHAVEMHYAAVQKERQPVALIGMMDTETIEELAPFVQQYGIPTFSVATAGSLGLLNSEPSEYSNIYPMVAPSGEVVELLDDLMHEYDFSHAAVIYDDAVHEENRIVHELLVRGDESRVRYVQYPLKRLADHAQQVRIIDVVLEKIESTGVQTFVVLLQDPYRFDELLTRAYRLGRTGDKKTARGYVWIAASGYLPWETPGAHREHYQGMLAVFQHTYDGTKMRKMLELWHYTMPRGCGVNPRGTKFSTIYRNHMPYESCVGLANSYDSVAAVALTYGRLAQGVATEHGQSRRLTEADQCEDSPYGARSDALKAALHEDTHFDGLGGRVERAGYPWNEKSGTWEVVNLNTVAEAAHPLFVHRWTSEEHLQLDDLEHAARRLAESHSDILTWPGMLHTKPLGMVYSPCTGVDCGSHGTCQARSAIARPAGFCKCDAGFIGRLCETLYFPHLPSDHPNVHVAPAKLTTVTLLPYVEQFFGINPDDGTFRVEVAEMLSWRDERVPETLDAGKYSFAEAMALREEGLLWIPDIRYDRCSERINRGGALQITASGDIAMVKYRVLKLGDTMAWRAFPFDEQTLRIRKDVVNPTEVELNIGSCSDTTLLPVVVQACSEMTEGSLGVPSSTLTERWEDMWLFHHSELIAATSAEGGTYIELDLVVNRDTTTFTWRILVPSFFLVVVSWAGFFVNPKMLMPRFASSFIAFLSLQSFKAIAHNLSPADASIITWIDVYMSAVGMLMVFAVIENMYAPFVSEHCAERSGRFFDRLSRCSFPLVFFTIIVTMVILRKEVQVLHVAVHVWLGAFATLMVVLGIWEYLTFIRSILDRELKRMKAVAASIEAGADVRVRLTIMPSELRSIFKALDKDDSGIVQVNEVWPYLATHMAVGRGRLKDMDSIVRQTLGDVYFTGVSLEGFDNLLTKILIVLVLPQDHIEAIMGKISKQRPPTGDFTTAI
eukprot:CAMPEP_0117489156 /NCGR_PEP_ID=MMETSP0784-20121206/16887_1 /TAXON_ID=39447 /ORGANISM="" /LENGTH=1051 /DNA_ID=CAMNT_0005283869 /DNA_START=107 /DNA_END=3262 /DNA_ORIENTATION=+